MVCSDMAVFLQNEHALEKMSKYTLEQLFLICRAETDILAIQLLRLGTLFFFKEDLKAFLNKHTYFSHARPKFYDEAFR